MAPNWTSHLVVRPILRWAGSKRRLLPLLRNLVPEFSGRYIEPFAGSAALFFELMPQAAILADLNSELVHFYNVVRDKPVEVFKKAAAYPRTSTTYYYLRDVYKPRTDVSRARRFVYLNRHCFNGIYRTNASGKFNVPYGDCKVGELPPLERFEAVSAALRVAEVVNQDYGDTLSQARRGDFCYIDPPYYTDSSRIFREYDNRPFGVSDLSRLREILVQLDRRGVQFMASYQAGEEALLLAAGFKVDTAEVRRTVAGTVRARGMAKELIIRNT